MVGKVSDIDRSRGNAGEQWRAKIWKARGDPAKDANLIGRPRSTAAERERQERITAMRGAFADRWTPLLGIKLRRSAPFMGTAKKLPFFLPRLRFEQQQSPMLIMWPNTHQHRKFNSREEDFRLEVRDCRTF